MPPKRGRLAAGEISASRLEYKCGAEKCDQNLRGDKLPDHYRKFADFDTLEIVKAMNLSDSEGYVKNKIQDQQKQNHTLFLLRGGYNVTNLPHFTTHKLSAPGPKKLTPFEQMAKRKKSDENKPEESDAENSSHEDENDECDNDSNSGAVQDTSTVNEPGEPDEIQVDTSEPANEETPAIDINEGTVYQQVRAALKDHDSPVTISNETIEQIVALTSARIMEMTKETHAENHVDDIAWIDVGNMIACRPCFNFSSSDDVPSQLKPSGNFGMIKKDQQPKLITRNKKKHCDLALHMWCVKKEKEESKCKAETKDKNNHAGEKVIRNALYCLKRGLGAEDFLGLNSKDLGSDIPNTATKNDSKAQYFKLRNIVF